VGAISHLATRWGCSDLTGDHRLPLPAIASHLGIWHRVHDILVAHVMLESSSVMPIVGEFVTGGVPKHVRMDREWKLCGLSSPGDRFQETCSRGGTTPLSDENVARFHVLAA